MPTKINRQTKTQLFMHWKKNKVRLKGAEATVLPLEQVEGSLAFVTIH